MSASQDMPPPGGFGSIKIERTFAKPLEWRKRWKVMRVEQQEHYVAVEPFLIAEQERKFLRQLRILREDERKLMKDHPGWKLGTLYGERIFKTLPKDKLPPIAPVDWTAHRHEDEWFMEYAIPDQHQ